MDISQAIYNSGVIDAGGGFHDHVKALSKVVDYVLTNGAECKPLLLKDIELIPHRAIETLEDL
ncbi:MAG: hypothetical protein J7K09_07255 [Desulfuromusa sp.]|nr:hypothetical protein [Desulfuromusa sp.]